MRLQCRILRNIAVSTGFLVWLLWLVWPAWSAATAAPRAQIVGKDGAPMALVPGGTFKMGSPEGTGEDDERPLHEVVLSPYYMDVFETTNRVYRRCVDAGACAPPEIRMLFDDPRLADHPVVIVDWEQARKFCQWAGKRLPTEAEWEFAARGPDGRIYPWGNEWDPSRANWNGEDEGEGTAGTKPVGSYPSGVSPFGIHEMAGNVWEWCADWHNAESYASYHDKTDPRGPRFGTVKVLRGGGWKGSGKETLRTANRFMDRPFEAYSLFGFRCAATPPGVPPPDPKTLPALPVRDDYYDDVPE